MNDELKCYWIGDEENGGLVYILHNRKEALALRKKVQDELWIESFIDVKVKHVKKADITGLKYGEVYGQIDDKEAVRRGLYSSDELYGECDWCGKKTDLTEPEDKLLVCWDCCDKWENGEEPPKQTDNQHNQNTTSSGNRGCEE